MTRFKFSRPDPGNVARAQVSSMVKNRPFQTARDVAAFTISFSATWTSIGTPIAVPVSGGSYSGIVSLNVAFAQIYTTTVPCTIAFRIRFSDGSVFDPGVNFIMPVGGPYLYSKTIQFPIGVIPSTVANLSIQYNDILMGHGLNLETDTFALMLPTLMSNV